MKTTLFKTGKAASLAVVAIAVVLALTSGAAYAAITSIGTLGTAQNKVAAASVAITTSAALEANNVGVVVVASDNLTAADGDNNEVTSVTDSAGNTWTQAREYSNGSLGIAGGSTVAVFYTKASNTVAAGGTITVNFSGSPASKAVMAWEFQLSIASANIYFQTGLDREDNAVDAGLITLSGLTNRDYLYVRGNATEITLTGYTQSASYTTMSFVTTAGGGAASNMGASGEFRLLAASTGDSTDPIVAPTTGDSAETMVAFYEITCANDISTCSQCHAYAPLDTANGDSIRNITTGAIKGDHQVTDHVPGSPTDADCNVCHTGVAGFDTKHRDGNITMAAVLNGGSYSRGASFAQSNNPTTGKCSNTQCHGIASPQWGVGSTDCSSCHPAQTGAGAVLDGKHKMHFNTSTATTSSTYLNQSTTGLYRINCGVCHDTAGQGKQHLDSSGQVTGYRVDVLFNSTQWSTTWSGTYSGGTTSTATASGSGFTYYTGRTCNNLYCHSTVQADGGSGAPTYTTPNWAAATTLGCNGCHATVPATGQHVTHATTMAYACTKCHKADAGAAPKHVNGVIDMQLINGASALYGQGNNVPRGGYSGCTNVYCHGAFNGANGTMNTPSWGNTAHGNCGTCHGATIAQTPSRINHPRHVGTGAGKLGTIGIRCADCHGSTAGAMGHENVRVSWNLNSATAGKLKLLAASPNPTYRAATSGTTSNAAPSPSYGTCGNIYCHSNVQSATGAAGPTTYGTPTWGATSIGCGTATCHGGTQNIPPISIGHAPHTNTATGESYVCNDCHNGGGNESVNHADKTMDFGFLVGNAGASGTYTQAGTAPGANGFGVCSNTKCHGIASPNWGTNYTLYNDCTICHGEPTKGADGLIINAAPGAIGLGNDTADRQNPALKNVGAHRVHLEASDSITAAMPCNTCHLIPANPKSVGHIDTMLPAEITFTQGLGVLNAAGASYNAATGDCSNVYCHNQAKFKTTRTTGAWYNAIDNTPTWTNTGFIVTPIDALGDCRSCHGYPPKPGHSSSANCSSCHPTTDANDLTFTSIANRAKHVDGAVQVQMVCDSCHGYPPRSGDSYDSPIYNAVNNEAGKGQHWTLAADGAHILNSALNKSTDVYPGAQCIKCHKGGTHTMTGGGTLDVIMNTPSLNFSATGNADYIGLPGDATTAQKTKAKTCSNVMCHFTTTPKWSCPQ